MSPLGVATSRLTYALETGQAKLWLLLVGVNHYQDAQLPPLRYSAIDCQGLAGAIADATQGFPQKALQIYHDFAPQQPTLANVRASLQEIVAAAQPQDTILFYFSGHGIPEPKTHQAFVCLADTQKHSLLNTALPVQELLQLLGQSEAQTQLVWLDACHSGEMTLRGAKAGLTAKPLSNPTPQMVELLRQRAKKSKGFYAMLSCDTDQQSWEFPELGHGVFTYYLMRGLRGEAADAQGLIEADSLYRYVYHKTRQYIEQTNQQLRLINQQRLGKGETSLYSEYSLQTPKRIVEGVGELILGLKPAQIVAPYSRQALVIEGWAPSQTTLTLSKLLCATGGFELEYWPRSGKTTTKNLQQAIQNCLKNTGQQSQGKLETFATVLLYIRGRLDETTSGEPAIFLAEDICLSRSWLRQQLRRSLYAQQIIILDCPDVGTKNTPSLPDWIEDLQLGADQGQCIIAAASPQECPEQFAQALLHTLKTNQPFFTLSAAGWITQLQISLANQLPLHIWLSGAQGVIEIIPASMGVNHLHSLDAIDLGLCPYRGLRAFGEEDEQYYYGRETLTQQLIDHLTQKSFLAVVGASGSGKSSLVQAGLIAQLRRGKQIPGSEKWWINSFRPGAAPLEALARRLGGVAEEDDRENSPHLVLEGLLYQGIDGFVYWLRSRTEPMVVLVVDQFEEIFTLAAAADREKFLKLLLGALESASDKFKLIITLRADFIATALAVPELAKLLPPSSLLVPPCLTKEEYRRVITHPAQQVGLTVEPELVEVLLQELHHSPGDLPLLEFVLEQLWEFRDGSKLTFQAYQQHLGGIKGALERKAQSVYDSLDSETQECARWIFLSLTQLGEGTEDTRRRIPKSELIVKKYSAQLVERTLQLLTAAKLIVVNWEENVGGMVGQFKGALSPPNTLPPSPIITIEVVHEVLIRHWSTLRWWLEENRLRLQKQRQIEQAATLWKHNDKQTDFLLQGVRLAEAEEIYINYVDELSFDVQQFITACLVQRQHLQQKEQTRLKQAQWAVAIISVLGMAALVSAGLAYQQSQKAKLQEIQALNSLSENFLLSHNQLEALKTSVKAARELQNIRFYQIPNFITTKTVKTLQATVYGTQERNRLLGHKSWVTSVSFSPNGQIIASAGADATIKLWKPDGTLLKTLSGHTDIVSSVRFSPDGQTIASASSDQTIKFWNLKGELLLTLAGHPDGTNSVSFSPNGQLLASAGNDSSVKLWSREGKLLKTLSGHTASVNSVSFSPQCHTIAPQDTVPCAIASASTDGTIKLWSPQGQLLKTLSGHTDDVRSINFSPDGQTLISASHDGTVKLWSVDGRLLKTINGHNLWVINAAFSPDGKEIASTSADKTMKIWSLDGTLLKTFVGHRLNVNSVSFSPDGDMIASASDDSSIKLWSRNEIVPITLKAHNNDIVDLKFSPDKKTLASASEDGTVKLWRANPHTGHIDTLPYKTLSGHLGEVVSVNFSPQGHTIVSTGADGTIKLWHPDGTLRKTLNGHKFWATSTAFSPDGKVLVSASADKTIKLWQQDGTLWKTLVGHKSWVTRVAFSPDGQMFVSASADGTIKLWSSDGTPLKTLVGHTGSVWNVSFSSDGTAIASASQDGTVRLWSRDGVLLATMTGHQDEVGKVSFSPDGQMIVSVSDDDTIKLWNRDGTLLRTFEGHNGNVRAVSFSPNGKMIVSGGTDETLKLWQLKELELRTLNFNELLTQACDRLHDHLRTNPKITPEERQLCD